MNDIDKLKELLFGHEKQALDAITRRLETPESRAADIADVLPDSINRSYRQDGRLARALEEPVEQGLKQSIRRDPQEFADALFPVMGPAIRKAIAEAIKAMVQQLNATIDSTLSPQRQISWRLGAWRAGVPLGEYVLQKTLLFRVEQAFLIHRESGLLVAHAHHPEADVRDSDAVSAMVTAIQDFVSDSFSQDQAGRLETADVGSFTLWAVHGPHAMLACAIRGVPPRALRAELTAVLEHVHLRYGDALEHFAGDQATVAGLDFELEHCLQFEQQDEAHSRQRGLSLPFFIVLATLGLGLAYLAVDRFMQARELNAFGNALQAERGIVVTDLSRRDGRIVVRGLRDPLAAAPAQLAGSVGIPVERLDLELAAYQSLEPEIVLARTRAVLAPPDGVTLGLKHSTLEVKGNAPAEWRARVLDLAPALSGIGEVRFLSAAPAAPLLERVQRVLVPPAGVSLELDGAWLSVTGRAPRAWIDSVPSRLASVDGLAGIDTRGLVSDSLVALRERARMLSERELFFAWRETLRPGQERVLAGLASALTEFGELARQEGYTPEIALVGHTDGLGPAELNETLQIMRAETVRLELAARGVDPAWLFVSAGRHASPDSGSSGDLRKVSLRVQAVNSSGRSLVGP